MYPKEDGKNLEKTIRKWQGETRNDGEAFNLKLLVRWRINL
jgi:hypothetical protein